jgi:hypothetical protein
VVARADGGGGVRACDPTHVNCRWILSNLVRGWYFYFEKNIVPMGILTSADSLLQCYAVAMGNPSIAFVLPLY